MLNIPEVIKELFMQDGIRKNFRVHFPNGERADLVNKDIIEESVKFTESTCSRQTLRFGLTEASVIEFECVGVENIAGMTIECGIEIDVSSLSRADREAYGTRTHDVPFPFYAVPYGVFVVDKCPRQIDMKRRKVTGYSRISREFPIGICLSDNDASLSFMARDFITASEIIPKVMPLAYNPERDTLYGGDNAQGLNYGFNGVVFTHTSVDSFEYTPQGTIDHGINWSLAVYIEAEADQYDTKANELFNVAMNACPKGATEYVYSGKGSGTPDRCFASTKQGYAVKGGCFRPFCYLAISGYEVERYSAPKFLELNRITLIDLRDMLSPIHGGAISFEILYVTLYIIMPVEWKKDAYWGSVHADTPVPVTNWPVPEDHRRRGDVKIRTLRILPTAGDFDIIIPATGKENIPVLGDYNTYYGAVKGDELLTDLFEMRGEVGNQKRDGTLSGDVLQRISPCKIASDKQMALWFEEAETARIGTVLYPYIEGNETREGALVIDDTNRGVYDMTENGLIFYLQDKTAAAVENFLISYFIPNTAQAFYTPIDLRIKGLPWLEDGDAIRIETPDGDVIESYILRHTISGVQHLVDDIEAQGEV